MLNRKIISIVLIFLTALVFRFYFFPQNVYFGFDQARDAYASLEILKGDLKIVGPPTANQKIHHGVLYYYIFAPIYFVSGGDPAAVSLFLRSLNAMGVLLLFLVVFPMFGFFPAIISSFLFAISYEQTQFSLFLNHPSLVVISLLIFYLGLSLWIFKKKHWGLIVAFLGLGFSIQFEFVETQLLVVFFLFLLFYRKHLPKLSFKNIFIYLLVFLLPVSSYLISEFKNNFITLRELPELLSLNSYSKNSLPIFDKIISRHLHDNFLADYKGAVILGWVFLVVLFKLIFEGKYRNQLFFLIFWFFGGLLVYFITTNDGYFYNTGTSVGLLVFGGFLISKIFSKNRTLAISILILVLVSNIYLILKNNPLGPNEKINPQKGLLLRDEEKVIDFIYLKANGEMFAVNALTMPYNVNTTWSYLFEWFGKKKYGYLPVWGGDAAAGFSGKLKIEKARSKLPNKRFLIIEPTEGIPVYLVDDFINNEETYSRIMEKKKIGAIQVWVQEPK